MLGSICNLKCSNTDEITNERIASARVLVITGPTEKFNVDEVIQILCILQTTSLKLLTRF